MGLLIPGGQNGKLPPVADIFHADFLEIGAFDNKVNY
jgi:hypothetical protein